jgi:hypothetical protein
MWLRSGGWLDQVRDQIAALHPRKFVLFQFQWFQYKIANLLFGDMVCAVITRHLIVVMIAC